MNVPIDLPARYRFWCHLRYRLRWPDYLKTAFRTESELIRFAARRGFKLTRADLSAPWPMRPSRWYYISALLDDDETDWARAEVEAWARERTCAELVQELQARLQERERSGACRKFDRTVTPLVWMLYSCDSWRFPSAVAGRVQDTEAAAVAQWIAEKRLPELDPPMDSLDARYRIVTHSDTITPILKSLARLDDAEAVRSLASFFTDLSTIDDIPDYYPRIYDYRYTEGVSGPFLEKRGIEVPAAGREAVYKETVPTSANLAAAQRILSGDWRGSLALELSTKQGELTAKKRAPSQEQIEEAIREEGLLPPLKALDKESTGSSLERAAAEGSEKRTEAQVVDGSVPDLAIVPFTWKLRELHRLVNERAAAGRWPLTFLEALDALRGAQTGPSTDE